MTQPASGDGFSFVDTDAHDGAWNMAFDIARAEAVDAGSAPPMLRVYRWAPWCISLGRHQSEEDIDTARAQREGIGIVRRPTGGRAILHAEELTYSVVMPSEGRGIMEVYKLISEALAEGLRAFVPEIEMAKSQPDFQKLYKEAGSIPCFSSSARYEIEFDGRKLVGSAQRRIGSTVLQHGSVLIGPAHLDLAEYLAVDNATRADIRADMLRHTVTLREVTGRDVTFEEVRDALRSGFEKCWGLRFSPDHGNDYISIRASSRTTDGPA
jgi:lipoate-protein ligase A